MDIFIPAVIALAGYVWLVLRANRTFHAIRKERFEHTNPAGVLQFDTYEELRKFESREASNQFWINVAAVPGGVIPLAAILAIIASIAEMSS
ncbi:hypothetical protein RMS29_027280 (plasmid) [Agrobacterium rosae]|uniref:Uncharacterized protein n=1 Tax=Agrobacterium rosae TaxID=1972867 RepID=A0ABU4W5E3_9HYPH|nr:MULTISPECIES: hypothetical protein [Rhizobium/Agrobacterium group]NTF22729.1 hypothetical protein [Agrobacterium rubi]MDX8332068.1 hypothetical protein [Agrobacterium rosae]NSY51451.1 hypothetical protein [Agrobacterium tumefaciens]NTF29586.1 hypothetical protein [Agrobacterium rubi]WCK17169.1 hypothetical protein G6L41_026830 [Agrobacterium tumefaciens]